MNPTHEARPHSRLPDFLLMEWPESPTEPRRICQVSPQLGMQRTLPDSRYCRAGGGVRRKTQWTFLRSYGLPIRS